MLDDEKGVERMSRKKIDLFSIIDDWIIPITLIEILIIVDVLIISLILQAFGMI